MRGILGAGNASLLGLLICAVPMVFGVWFAPSERVLSLMRPLTLMGIFSAMGSFVLGLANVAALLHAAAVPPALPARRGRRTRG